MRPRFAQLGAQRLAGARQARLHGADGDAERKRDLFVAQAVDFAQHDRRPLIERQVVERVLQLRLASSFCASTRSGVGLAAREKLAVRRDVRIERDLVGPVAPAPEAVAVARLVDGNAIDPGPQARLAAEAMDGAEDAEEDFLREVERFVAVAEQVHRQLDDHPLVLGHQLGAGGLVAGGAPLHERRFATADVRPTDDARLLHRELPL